MSSANAVRGPAPLAATPRRMSLRPYADPSSSVATRAGSGEEYVEVRQRRRVEQREEVALPVASEEGLRRPVDDVRVGVGRESELVVRAR